MNILKMTQSSLLGATIIAGSISTASAQQAPLKSSPQDLVDALHTAFGNNHSRAVHAKGIILEGTFTPDKAARSLTKASHLQKESSKVVVRFSNFTGIPNIPDNIPPANPRGLAIKFISSDGATTDIVGHSFNGFPTSNSDDFRELLLAIGASGADAPPPTKLDNFLASHPVAKTFLTTQHNPASYASINYFGVNAFKFTNEKGESHYIRYQFIPVEGERLLSAEEMQHQAADYLQAEIKTHIMQQHIRFRMYAQVAEAGDVIEDPSIAWPDNRKRVFLGIIELKALADNTTEGDKALSFIPNNVPVGIETADPMLNFRSKAYPISVKERQ